MKLAVYGAGAIGGVLGARLTEAGADVTLIARGAHLAAMRERGLTLITSDRKLTLPVSCTDRPAEAGPQDAVFLTLKAHSLPEIAEAIQPLLGPETAVVTAQNGIPWWYFYRHGGPHDGHRLTSLDPDGRLREKIRATRCIGCVLYPAAEIVEPGVVRHPFGEKFVLGEPDGSDSPRCRRLSEALGAAGLEAPVHPRIRDEIWLKLWGNVSFNPISALTGATLAGMARDPGSRAVARSIMEEAQAVGEALGVRFAVDIDTRIGWAAAVGEHKTSMLQDLEAGRPMEIDALAGVVAEMGRLTGVATPFLDSILALVVQKARLAGCYPG
jgi:2-dehydropantoate 2-reductase